MSWGHLLRRARRLKWSRPQIMFYGYPVERLCTYQYSLISLMPGQWSSLRVPRGCTDIQTTASTGLLMNLADAGSPKLDFRAGAAQRPTSLKTSDRNSLLRYMGLPLHTFGKVDSSSSWTQRGNLLFNYDHHREASFSRTYRCKRSTCSVPIHGLSVQQTAS
jgi:hypothetical protein